MQQFDGDLAHLGMNYRGGLNAAHVGLDLYADERMLAGLSFMRSWGELDYTDDGVDGVMESGMNTVHPYVYWQPGDRVSVWGIGGLGRGQVDVTEPGRTHDFGADFRMFAGGVRAALLRRAAMSGVCVRTPSRRGWRPAARRTSRRWGERRSGAG